MGKGSLSAIAAAIDLAVAEGADVINLSLTAKGESATVTQSIDNAVAKNVNVVGRNNILKHLLHHNLQQDIHHMQYQLLQSH